jgi:hypothetical protein
MPEKWIGSRYSPTRVGIGPAGSPARLFLGARSKEEADESFEDDCVEIMRRFNGYASLEAQLAVAEAQLAVADALAEAAGDVAQIQDWNQPGMVAGFEAHEWFMRELAAYRTARGPAGA